MGMCVHSQMSMDAHYQKQWGRQWCSLLYWWIESVKVKGPNIIFISDFLLWVLCSWGCVFIVRWVWMLIVRSRRGRQWCSLLCWWTESVKVWSPYNFYHGFYLVGVVLMRMCVHSQMGKDAHYQEQMGQAVVFIIVLVNWEFKSWGPNVIFISDFLLWVLCSWWCVFIARWAWMLIKRSR